MILGCFIKQSYAQSLPFFMLRTLNPKILELLLIQDQLHFWLLLRFLVEENDV